MQHASLSLLSILEREFATKISVWTKPVSVEKAVEGLRHLGIL